MKSILSNILSIFVLGTIFISCNIQNSDVNLEYKATYSFTESPVLLENYEGSAGPSSDTIKYYIFGDFPQTIINESVKLSSLPAANGYYVGSDGNYYAKIEEDGYPTSVMDGLTYSDGTKIAKKSQTPHYLYFKVEPIVWRALTDSYDHDKKEQTEGKTLLLAENILTSNIPFCVSYAEKYIEKTLILPNNYKYSTIRAYLNGKYESKDPQKQTYKDQGFLQTAFTKDAQKKILVTCIDNSLEQMSYDGEHGKIKEYYCENTKDKIFMLSELEMVKAGGYDFYEYDKNDLKRIRYATDYAKANYSNLDEENGSWWWLRSPNCIHSICSRNIRETGYSDYCSIVLRNGGIVPAITISINEQ